MNNAVKNFKSETEKLEISTNIETVDINNSKWHGTIKNSIKEMDVTMYSITALFSRNDLLLESISE